MWLLETRTLILRYFVSPEAVREGYSILSHVWDAEEQSFQDLKSIHARCAESGESPHDLVSEKIRKCCEVAAQRGYKWVWIDTCCIDKTSSAELSETINSMYHYYALSMVCFAYLRDVSISDESRMDRLQFEKSEWHRRGWTLQELVAPRTVLFLSQDWRWVGSKASHAFDLERITRIPGPILRLQLRPSEVSIAQRMSWAANRRTTRLEDEAYCLLGIFDINMPTLYGEGRKAFRRLQEEIMKASPDTTLFAWGDIIDLQWRTPVKLPGGGASGFFATSPAAYCDSGDVKSTRYWAGMHEVAVSSSLS